MKRKILPVFVLMVAHSLACSLGGAAVDVDSQTAQAPAVSSPQETQDSNSPTIIVPQAEGYESLDEIFPLDPENLPIWSDYTPQDLPAKQAPNPVSVTAALNEAVSTSKEIGPKGGSLELATPDGVIFTLEVPPDALLSKETIQMTLVQSMTDEPAQGLQLHAVNLQPDNLAMLRPVNLLIQLPAGEAAEDYLGFTSNGLGVDLQRIMAVSSEGQLRLSLMHFSTPGVTSFDNDAKNEVTEGFWEALLRAEPSDSAGQARQRIAEADEEHGITSGEFVREATINKSRWFWDPADGVITHLDNAVNNPETIEIAILQFLQWRSINSVALKDYYLLMGVDYPFSREEKIAELLISMALKAGLDTPCSDPIDALRKIRYLRLAQVLSGPDFNIAVFGGVLDFTEAYAQSKAEACAQFSIDFTSTVDGLGPEGQIYQTATAKELQLAFNQESEAVTLRVNQTSPPLGTTGECEWFIFDGQLEALNLTWPVNIFYNHKQEFKNNPPTVTFYVSEMPSKGCKQMGPTFGTLWWAIFTYNHGFLGDQFDLEITKKESKYEQEVSIPMDNGTFDGSESTTVIFNHTPDG